ELENQVGSLKEQHLRDSADLKTLLSKAENQAKDVQKEPSILQPVPAVFIGLFLAFLFWCFGPLW
ncbi:SLMAP isoform 6, partial [Pan troglodytes]